MAGGLREFGAATHEITESAGRAVAAASKEYDDIVSGIHDIEVAGEFYSPSTHDVMGTVARGEAVSAGTSHLTASANNIASRLEKVSIFSAHKTVSSVQSQVEKMFEQATNKIANNIDSISGMSFIDLMHGLGGNKFANELWQHVRASLSLAQHQLLSEVLTHGALRAVEAGIDNLSRKIGINSNTIKSLLPIIRNAGSAITIGELTERLIAAAAKKGIELSEESASMIIMFVKTTDVGFFTLAKNFGIKYS